VTLKKFRRAKAPRAAAIEFFRRKKFRAARSLHEKISTATPDFSHRQFLLCPKDGARQLHYVSLRARSCAQKQNTILNCLLSHGITRKSQ